MTRHPLIKAFGLPGLSLALAFSSLSCRKAADPETTRQLAVKQTIDKLRSCLPALSQNDAVQLSLVSVARTPTDTRVRLVAYATATVPEPVEFYLPVYLMSRGRWLINIQERVYLLDETCREHKMKDRHPSGTEPFPAGGLIKLQANTAFEFSLSFPPLPDQTQVGALVYGSRVIPFSLLVETR